jgi:hypothetical protein
MKHGDQNDDQIYYKYVTPFSNTILGRRHDGWYFSIARAILGCPTQESVMEKAGALLEKNRG